MRRETQVKNLRLTGRSRQRVEADHMRVPTPMRRADWPVARSLQGQSVQTQTVTPGNITPSLFRTDICFLIQEETCSVVLPSLLERSARVMDLGVFVCLSGHVT